MVRFRCEYCGAAVQAEEVHADKKGRCFSCGSLLTIRAPSCVASAVAEKVSTVSAARWGADKGKLTRGGRGSVPPPPAVGGNGEEELELAALDGDPCGDTQILNPPTLSGADKAQDESRSPAGKHPSQQVEGTLAADGQVGLCLRTRRVRTAIGVLAVLAAVAAVTAVMMIART